MKVSRNGFSATTIAILTLLAVGLVPPETLLAKDESTPPVRGRIEPPNVFLHLEILKAEIELIRQEMGRKKAEAPLFQVRNATPREVYGQARTLFTKANRLAFDVIRTNATPPSTTQRDIRPADVLGLVLASLERTREVKERLSIIENVAVPERMDDKTPSDVFNEIIAVNRQLNLLLERRFTPGDVHAVISATVYHASLLEREEIRNVIPRAERSRRKRPVDVFQHIAECYQTTHAIALKSGHPIAELRLETEITAVNPSDVYDLSSLLLSELVFLDDRFNSSDSRPAAVHFSGYKVPSDCFQRSGVLLKQLEMVKDRALGG